MPATLTRRPSPGSNRQAVPLYLLSAALCTAVLLPVALALRDPPRVDLVIRNDTRWDVELQVITDSGSVRPITTVGDDRTTAVDDVLVPGPIWRFQWTIAGREMHQSGIGHEELKRRNFEISVPDEVVAAAEAEGIRPTGPRTAPPGREPDQ